MKKINLIMGIAIMLFTVNLNAGFSMVESKDCMDQALMVGQQAYAAGKDDEESTYFMNVAYALCEGYSMDDINM